jgi:hypothetical protein
MNSVVSNAHSTVTHIEQQYFPPPSNSSAGSSGSWTTFVFFNHGSELKVRTFEGMGSEQERDWLGPIIAKWANKPLRQSDCD